MKLRPQKLTLQDRLDWIRLARTSNIGPATFFRIMEIFDGDVAEAIDKTPELSKNGGIRKGLKIFDRFLAEKELEDCEKFGAEILTFVDDDYPRMVREIYDPAPILTVKGDKKLLNRDAIGVVGPRNASFHACKFAEQIAAELSGEEIVIVSGLAKGIDAAAHRGSLRNGTVAVIAGGIDNVYPYENSGLYKNIFEQGIIVSEQPFSGAPRGSNFIQRNRIISGISYGIVVVEAGVQSGSLATARFALDQGREVFAVPGFPADPRTHGSNLLIDEGAIFTVGSDRVLKEMRRLRQTLGEVGILKEPDAPQFVGPYVQFPSDDDILKVREEVSDRIGTIPLSIEDIIDFTGAPARIVNVAIVQLELADKVAVIYGKVVKKMG